MSPSSKMGDGVQQQRWDFRRKDTDIDSSSDESESSIVVAHKKHKLISSLNSLENDEDIDNSRVQQTGMWRPRTADQITSRKGKRVHLRSRKKDNWIDNEMEKDSRKELSRKKSKTSVYDPAALDELKIFTDSLLEDLKVTRENLLSWMRKEMQKLVADDAAPRLGRGKESSRGKTVRVKHGDNCEENIQVHTKRRFEEDLIQHQHRNNFEEDVLVQHDNNYKENVIAQHHNKFKEVVLVQHENNSEENLYAQHQNNSKETVQVQHQDSFEEGNFQANYHNNFGSCVESQQCDIESVERSLKCNTTSGYDNYPVKPNFQSCSTEKDGEVQHQMNYISGTGAQTYSYGSLESSLTGKKTSQSNNFHPLIEHRADCVQEIGSRTSSDKERGGKLGLSFDSKYSPNLPSQVASSMYLTLPTVLTKPGVENHMLSTSLSSHIQTSFDRNRLDVNNGKVNPMLKVSGHQEKISGLQEEVRSGSFPLVGSRNVSCFDKQSIPSSSIGTGFPVTIHRGMDIGVNVPSQASFEYLPQEEKIPMGLRMDEGASRFSTGGYAIPEDYLSNSFYNRSIGKSSW